jgi:hypothetical protein
MAEEKIKKEESSEQSKESEDEEKIINPIDAGKATRTVTEYLEAIYGNLSMLLFRIEDVRQNGDSTRYLVLCSLLTNIGGPRSYYFMKVDIKNGTLLKVSKGIRDVETGKIEWKQENLPSDEE